MENYFKALMYAITSSNKKDIKNYFNIIEKNLSDFVSYSINDITKDNKSKILLNQKAQYLSAIYSIYLKDNTLLDFIEIPITNFSKYKVPSDKVLIKNFKIIMKDLINVENIKNSFNKDQEKTWKMLIDLNKKDYFDDNLIKYIINLYDLNDNNDKKIELLKSSSSFHNLNILENNGFNIWVSIYKDEDKKIKTLLPFLVFEKEENRTDLTEFSKTNILIKLRKIINSKEIWGKNISKEDLLVYNTRIAYLLALKNDDITDKIYVDFLKQLNISKKDLILSLDDIRINTNAKINLKELLFINGRLTILEKLINKNERLIDDNDNNSALIKLLSLEPDTTKEADLISTKNKFTKVWLDSVVNTDLNEISKKENFLSQIFNKAIYINGIPQPCLYLPIKKRCLQETNKKFIYYHNFVYNKDNNRLISLLETLNLFQMKGVNFQHLENGEPIYSKLLLSFFSFERESFNQLIFADNNLMRQEYNKFNIEEKIKIWNTFSDNWINIWSEKRQGKYRSDYLICKYENDSLIINVLDMFAEELFKEINVHPEKINNILNDLNDYKSIKQFDSLFKKIEIYTLKNNLSSNLDTKSKKNIKTNKI